ncbi:MAG TPA: uracil-DNA glycosylase [Minicystis sp.]|nr:uracil-DNA glycosylase [Minicystis sp.]
MTEEELAAGRVELAALVASVRALVELHEMAGTTGLPLAGRERPATLPAEVPAAPAQPPAAVRVAPVAPAAAPRPAVTPPKPAEPTEPADDDRVMRLAVLAERARACEQCALCQRRKQAVFSRGNPHAELCFVGEGPGADEDAIGEPFVGKAGQLLDRMIAAMGYGRDDVYICNVVKCRPPDNRKPDPEEMAACLPFLHQQLELVKPKAIVALGATAVQGLTGTSEGITRLRGKWRLYKGTIPVMPTFHPAYLLRQPAAKRDVWSDLQDVMRILGKKP